MGIDLGIFCDANWGGRNYLTYINQKMFDAGLENIGVYTLEYIEVFCFDDCCPAIVDSKFAINAFCM